MPYSLRSPLWKTFSLMCMSQSQLQRTFWFLGSSVSYFMPPQPRLFFWIVHFCFSSRGASKSFLPYNSPDQHR